jgi:NADH-quinone oxidoreductase subunit M
MTLITFIGILMAGGVLAWIAARWSEVASRWISLIAVLVDLVWSVWILVSHRPDLSGTEWLIRFDYPWIGRFGIGISVAADGLSLLLLILTFFLGVVSVLVSWREIQDRVGFFHFNLLWVLAGIAGVFVVMDLFLFYFFWEVMLIPMYFLIGIWGHENRRYAAVKFFIFTQASGLMMLLSILGLYFIHGSNTGTYTFDYFELLTATFSSTTGRWLMLGFLAAFIVKLPVVPFHSWLPDAHSQAPTAGSVILAGLLLKTGAYGMLRFVLPLFPEAAHDLAYVAMAFGVVGILYGALLAYGQSDLKRLVAYTSVSHMGFVMLGIFAFNELALQGVVMQLVAHGLSTGALFVIAGLLYERIHTRDLSLMGGFWPAAPFMGFITLVFVMASLGLPGLANFIAEFLTLNGAWRASPLLTVLGSLGLVLAMAYSLRIMRKIFFGPPADMASRLRDLNLREKVVLVPMTLLVLFLGLFPQYVFGASQKSVRDLLEMVMRSQVDAVQNIDETP